MRVLVLGITGLLGSAVFHVLSEKKDWRVFGTLRTEESKRFFAPVLNLNLVVGVDDANTCTDGRGTYGVCVSQNATTLARDLAQAGSHVNSTCRRPSRRTRDQSFQS